MSDRCYMARNLDVANAYGLEALLGNTLKRVNERKDSPTWLKEALHEAHQRASLSIRPLIEYRDAIVPDRASVTPARHPNNKDCIGHGRGGTSRCCERAGEYNG